MLVSPYNLDTDYTDLLLSSTHLHLFHLSHILHHHSQEEEEEEEEERK